MNEREGEEGTQGLGTRVRGFRAATDAESCGTRRVVLVDTPAWATGGSPWRGPFGAGEEPGKTRRWAPDTVPSFEDAPRHTSVADENKPDALNVVDRPRRVLRLARRSTLCPL